jgi:hypothetical protein
MFEVTFGKERYHQINDMVRWCKDNIGDGGWLAGDHDWWACEGAFGNTTFKFKRDADHTMFLLRWA